MTTTQKKDSYVAILVDGDGAIFNDNFLGDPGRGADEVARLLKQQVANYLGVPVGGDMIIFARVFANVEGLAKKLQKSRIITSPNDMYKFAEMFTLSCAEFDFVNVGYGKENADFKIRRRAPYITTICR